MKTKDVAEKFGVAEITCAKWAVTHGVRTDGGVKYLWTENDVLRFSNRNKKIGNPHKQTYIKEIGNSPVYIVKDGVQCVDCVNGNEWVQNLTYFIRAQFYWGNVDFSQWEKYVEKEIYDIAMSYWEEYAHIYDELPISTDLVLKQYNFRQRNIRYLLEEYQKTLCLKIAEKIFDTFYTSSAKNYIADYTTFHYGKLYNMGGGIEGFPYHSLEIKNDIPQKNMIRDDFLSSLYEIEQLPIYTWDLLKDKELEECKNDIKNHIESRKIAQCYEKIKNFPLEMKNANFT